MRTIASPLRFFILFFSSFLQAYILPVARTWQAHTSPNPPLPKTRYIRKVLYVTGWLSAAKWLTNKTVNRIMFLCVCVSISLCLYTFRAISTASNGESTSSSRNP